MWHVHECAVVYGLYHYCGMKNYGVHVCIYYTYICMECNTNDSQIDEQLAHAKYIYAGKRDIEQMKNLRKQMPSVFPLLVSLHKNTTNTDIGKL